MPKKWNKRKWYLILLLGLVLLLGSSVIGCSQRYTQEELDAAREAGYAEGYNVGLADLESAKKEATKQGYDKGYWAGYGEAQGEGYDRGYADGYEQGRDERYFEGLEDGKQLGYAVGYAEGCKACRKISGDGPQPPDGLSLTIISVTSPVSPGQDATLKARAPPGAQCTIIVYYKSGPGTALGLYSKQADSNGDVSWTWKVGTRTTPGNWRIVVTATYAGKTVSQETRFTVR